MNDQQIDALAMSGNWLTIEVIYKAGDETKRTQLTDQNWHQVKEFRKTIYSGGLMLPLSDVAPGIVSKTDRWFIVSPCNIVEVVITRQSKKFGK